MYDTHFPVKRYRKTLSFIKKYIGVTQTILDLGVKNPFTSILLEEGYSVYNSSGEDLDEDYDILKEKKYDVLVALEIFEHLLNPYTILKNSTSSKIIISVPLRLWFSSAYRSKTDLWDRHYHEFEEWQLDWLLEKTGWKIIDREKWTNPVRKIGIRPFLRFFTPRYYIVYAERIQ